MSITEKENDLFDSWKANHDHFVEDGVVDKDCYLESKHRLVFILKEANDPNGGGWDLRKFLRDGARPQTWNNITRWVMGIRELERDIGWRELENINNEQRTEMLQSICAMNLKKSPGGRTTDNEQLSAVAKMDRDYLNKQFNLYESELDLVICCGSVTTNIFHEQIDIEKPHKKKMTKRGIWFHEYRTSKFIISYFHPQARVSGNLLYYGIVDAVREILSRNAD